VKKQYIATRMKQQLTLVFIICSALIQCGQPPEKPKSFYVAGHAYGSPYKTDTKYYSPLKLKIDSLQKDGEIMFGIYTGDVVKQGDSAHWKGFIKGIDAFKHPSYLARGNHDYQNKELLEKAFPNAYYSFNSENIQHIILDANPDSWCIKGQQLEFLKETLSSFKGKATFIYTHQILWLDMLTEFELVPNSYYGKADTLNFKSDLWPLLKNHKKPIFLIAGDAGAHSGATALHYFKEDNVRLITSGMGAGDRDNIILVSNSVSCLKLEAHYLNSAKTELLEELKFDNS